VQKDKKRVGKRAEKDDSLKEKKKKKVTERIPSCPFTSILIFRNE